MSKCSAEEIKIHRVIYYKTYDDYRRDFEDQYTYEDWWDIRGNPYTISCIDPKYFNEMESDGSNVLLEEVFSNAAPLTAPILIVNIRAGMENAEIVNYTANDTEGTKQTIRSMSTPSVRWMT